MEQFMEQLLVLLVQLSLVIAFYLIMLLALEYIIFTKICKRKQLQKSIKDLKSRIVILEGQHIEVKKDSPSIPQV